ncbi:MAG: VIT and vWA domain-containing protein [Planctomycetota bacterium]
MKQATQAGIALAAAALAALLPSQSPHATGPWRHQWVVPSRAVLAPYGTPPVRVQAAKADVVIRDRAATTTLEFELHNPAGRQQEAALLLPVPDGAAVSNFTFEGPASEPTAKILPRDEARKLYDQITSRLKDPALLEFAGYGCLRSSVFPVPANGRQKIRLTYDHVLEVDGDRVDYLLPRSEMLTLEAPWSITVDLQARATIGVCYSPSHELHVTRRGAKKMTLRVTEGSQRDPGAFRLCFTTSGKNDEPTAAMFTYPDPTVGGGYFLLLANAPKMARAKALRREVTLVLDRSGSMAGRKLEQAKAAALQVLEGLGDGEGIQIIHYGNDVGRAFEQPVAKDERTTARARRFLDDIRPHGGTNIHDALLEALRAPVMPDTLPLVLFLTDGLPTVGPTSERDLFRLIEKGNQHSRRVFCFGVGNDVNVPLLDRIADETRAVTTYVQPEEDVEVKVARTFARLDHPVLASPVLRTIDAQGATVARTAEVLPRRINDLFAGEQLVLMGQYRGEDDLTFELHGRTPAGEKRYRFTLPVRSASTRHAFVPRLWASRQIAFLVDELRQQGGDLGAPFGTPQRDPFSDPRLRELRDEILRLSTRFGVLGEYTAFLAREGSRLDDWNALSMACQSSLKGRAVVTRSGKAAVNQGENLWKQKAQLYANPRNVYLDQDRNRVELSLIQQVCDRGFFKRGNRWVDGNSVVAQTITPHQTIALASPAYFALARRLESEGRCGLLSMPGEILVEVDGKNVLVTNPVVVPATPKVPDGKPPAQQQNETQKKTTQKKKTQKKTTPKKKNPKKEIR